MKFFDKLTLWWEARQQKKEAAARELGKVEVVAMPKESALAGGPSRADSGYKRTTGGKHRWKRRCWMPAVRNGIARMLSGARYEIRGDGWRRLHDLKAV